MLNLDDPISLALLTAECFARAGLEHALYGGLALAAYGRPRETKDADVSVLDADAARAAAALEAADVTVSIAFERVAFGGLWLSRLTVLGGDTTAGLNMVGLVQPRSARFATAVLERAIEAPLRGQTIAVVSPEDFILLEILSTRDTDLNDAATVISRAPELIDDHLLDEEIALLEREIHEHPIAERWRATRHIITQVT